MGTMKLQHLPNVISSLRIALIFPVIYGVLQGYYFMAFLLFVIAGFSDGLDGYLARHYGWTSRFGSVIDPLADKFLLMSCFATLVWLGNIPLWLFAIVLFRDLWIMSGVVAYHFLIGQPEFTPRALSKLNTFLQILLVGLLLFSLSIIPLSPLLLNVIGFLVLLTSVLSFIEYTWIWGKRAWMNYFRRLSLSRSSLQKSI